MAKLFTIKIDPPKPRSRVIVSMQAQGLVQKTMKDRRMKRRNRQSWRKDETKSW